MHSKDDQGLSAHGHDKGAPEKTLMQTLPSDALLILRPRLCLEKFQKNRPVRSEEHTSELQSLMRISYAVFCLKKKNQTNPSNIHKPQYSRNPKAYHAPRQRLTSVII